MILYMSNEVRNILDILMTMGGLAMGAVISLLSAILLLLSEFVPLDRTTLALTWIMVALVFAFGFYTAKRQAKVAEAGLGQEA